MKRLIGIRSGSSHSTIPVSEPVQFPLPKRTILPLGTQWGDMSPLVQSGDTVRGGQPIAEDLDGLLPPLHASVSGTVLEIKPWPSFSGLPTRSIIIESSGDDGVEPFSDKPGIDLDPYETLQLLKKAGIREVDSYAWPLSVRIAQPALVPPLLLPLAPALMTPIEHLIINAMDRQPGTWLRQAALAEGEGDPVLESVAVLRKLSAPGRTVLAAFKSQPLPERLERILRQMGVEVVRCPDRYPAALEPILVQYVTGRQVPQPSGDARAVGAVVLDVVTARQIYQSLQGGAPAVETSVQITAPAQGIHACVQVRIGMLLDELLSHLSPAPEEFAKAIIGGPFLGYAQHQLQVPITPKTDAVDFQDSSQVTRYDDHPCIRCGTCVRSCPMGLLPNDLSRFCEYGRFRDAEKNFLFHCIECGICAYVCPVKRPMVHLLRFGKQELIQQREAS